MSSLLRASFKCSLYMSCVLLPIINLYVPIFTYIYIYIYIYVCIYKSLSAMRQMDNTLVLIALS